MIHFKPFIEVLLTRSFIYFLYYLPQNIPQKKLFKSLIEDLINACPNIFLL